MSRPVLRDQLWGIVRMARPLILLSTFSSWFLGVATMKSSWRRFLNDLPIESKFLHRDEHRKIHGEDTPLPATFIEEYEELILIISSVENGELTTLKGLETLIKIRLREHGII
jgi:hypothetical protein